MDDKQIIQLFFDRNEKAIEATADKYGNYCNSIAFNILSNSEDAEECVNDTYVKAWNSIPPSKPSELRTFLGKITRNLAFDVYKKKKTEKRGGGQIDVLLDELAECIPGGNEPDKEYDKKELQNDINDFLGCIDKEKSALFVRRYWYSESITKIADRYHMSENRVSVTLNRIRKKLHNYLAERGYDV